jgi:hypothetical protein
LKAHGIVTAGGRAALRSQTVTLKRGQHAKFPPHAFTEHGAIMAAMVLNSPQAVTMSVYVVRAFAQTMSFSPAVGGSWASRAVSLDFLRGFLLRFGPVSPAGWRRLLSGKQENGSASTRLPSVVAACLKIA